MSSSSSKMIMVRSSDGEIVEINETVALESQTIKNIMEDESADHSVIPLPKITAPVLSKIIEYLKKHVESREKGEDLKSFDAEFVKVDNTALVDLIQAANYLKIKSLVDLTATAAADLIRGKTTEEMREIFNNVNDFTPEEEEKVRLENEWAF